MTPYERGYAAGLKAAAALVPTDDTLELCCNGYDCECRKPEDAAFVAAEIEARRVKKAILSLPIPGEADQRGAAFGSAKPVSAGSNASQEASVSPAAQYVPHPNPGEQVAENHKGAPEVRAPARSGPCVSEPLPDFDSLADIAAEKQKARKG